MVEVAVGGPFGRVGDATGSACRCGAGLHAADVARCANGHVLARNGLAVVTGASSAAFWEAAEAARREIETDVIRDAGHDGTDAPRTLRLAAAGLAQAALVRDSAFLRVVEAGGPLTTAGKTRRALIVWQAATDRVERYLRLLGLRRVPKPAPSLSEYLRDLETRRDSSSTEPTDDPRAGEPVGDVASTNITDERTER